MQFTLPQFIEHEAKIQTFSFMSITFKQFFMMLAGGGLCFIIYFSLREKSFLVALLLIIIVLLITFSLAYLKVNGRPLTVVLADMLNFSIGKKIYLWQRKDLPIKMMKRTEIKSVKGESPSLKFAEKSRLKKLSNQIEIKI